MPSMKLSPSGPAAALTFRQWSRASRSRVGSSSTHLPRIRARPAVAPAIRSISASVRPSPSSAICTSNSSSASVPKPPGGAAPTVTRT